MGVEDCSLLDGSMVEYANALLVTIPNLKEVRFSLVPTSLTEEQFWGRFLNLIKYSIIITIFPII